MGIHMVRRHCRSLDAREQGMLLSARTTLVRRLRDIENSVRGLLRGFGFRFPRVLLPDGHRPSAILSLAI
jgi:transposase